MIFRKTSIVILSIVCVLLMSVLSGCDEQKEQEKELNDMLAQFNEDISKKSEYVVEHGADDSEVLKIGSVNMGMNGEWFSEVMNGIWDASEDLGVTAMMLDSEGDMEKEKNNIKKLVNEGIDALVISPIDSEGSIPALKPAVDAGIPIITWNTSVNTDDITSFVCVDSDALGGDTGDYLCEYIKTYGLNDVNLIIIDNKNYDVGIARCEGFRSSIKNMTDRGIIKITAQKDAETYDAGLETTAQLLEEHPEANAVWAWNQPSFLGAIEAVRRSGRSRDIMIMGADMSMELAYDMLSDDIDLLAITTQLPYNMGYKAVATAVDAIHKKPIDKIVPIPLFTYTKSDRALVERYIEAHKDLITWEGGQWYE